VIADVDLTALRQDLKSHSKKASNYYVQSMYYYENKKADFSYDSPVRANKPTNLFDCDETLLSIEEIFSNIKDAQEKEMDSLIISCIDERSAFLKNSKDNLPSKLKQKAITNNIALICYRNFSFLSPSTKNILHSL
jgi:hypothetical protein